MPKPREPRKSTAVGCHAITTSTPSARHGTTAGFTSPPCYETSLPNGGKQHDAPRHAYGTSNRLSLLR